MNNRQFIYTYVRHRDEQDLCRMEMRAFFGYDVASNILKSPVEIEPSRSPFMKEGLDVLCEDDTLEGLYRQIECLESGEPTFKVLCLNSFDLGDTKKIGFAERRRIERDAGLRMPGEPDLNEPQKIFGILNWDSRWYFGEYKPSEAVWHQHQQKPHMYSTALGTRLARAVTNIAVPFPEGIRAIDPCCGIGTVLVEALSMGIDMKGRDINPLVVWGSRKNIRHFGLDGEVTIGPIAAVADEYDVAIIDMPYNLFTHITDEGQLDILKEARRFTSKLVVVTIDTIDHMISEAGFSIIDRCVAKKGTFSRQILVCE
ncbi:RNA methyltransferase [Sporosarcina sp. 179-K 3D1 HS]|uniref:TRM11 family SAM-dependent methyltransferase n=1 Tax=Sporosarcina sp. 179-K 3D1 HS TaxID=3232169 RepID=UPI0039A226B1